MAEPFLGEVKIISWNFPPKGWSFCNGQLLPINQNQALFSILGTTYGGDGRVTFGLPNLQGRMPVHVGDGVSLGELGGHPAHTTNTADLSQRFGELVRPEYESLQLYRQLQHESGVRRAHRRQPAP